MSTKQASQPGERLAESTPRLLLALIIPTLLVAWGMRGLQDVRAAFMLYVVGGCALLPWLLLGIRPLTREGGLSFTPPRSVSWRRAAPLLAFLLFGPTFLGVYALLQPHLGSAEVYLEQLHQLGWQDEHQLLYSVLFVLLIPLFEEWWWRGQALPRCVARFGARIGVAATALGFAGYHFFSLASLYDLRSTSLRWIAIFLAGWLWTWVAYRRQSWRLTYVAHLAADLAIVVAFDLFVAHPGG